MSSTEDNDSAPAKPRKAVVMDLHIEADDFETLASEFRHMDFDISSGGMRSHGCSAGGGARYHWNTTHDPSITPEQDRKNVEAYLAALARDKEGE